MFNLGACALPEAVFPRSATMANPIAVMDTSMGVMKVEIYLDRVPITASNFIDLAQCVRMDGADRGALQRDASWDALRSPRAGAHLGCLLAHNLGLTALTCFALQERLLQRPALPPCDPPVHEPGIVKGSVLP